MNLRGTLNIVLGILLVAGSARATLLTVEVRDASGDPHSVDVASTAQNVPMTLELFVTSDFDMGNLQLKVESLDGTGIFALNARTFDSAAGWGYYPLAFTAPDNMTGAPGGQSSQLIGCLSVDDYVSAGTSRFVTIDAIVKAGTPPGQYHLNATSVLAGDANYQDVFGSGGQSYVVNVLPEPVSLLLLVAGGGLVLRRRRVRV